MDNQFSQFQVSVYGNLDKISDTISKARCRIFYRGANRNGTYITDEFANKLLSTISYSPVKGIFDNDVNDYEDHGKARNLGRIYGVVPENPNLKWEDHEDEDGVVRTYACVDVYLYTALYAEANMIVGKSQSMELLPSSIKGQYKFIDGKKQYVYTDASFLGLQVLGDQVEPCFEGSAFFSLYQEFMQKLGEVVFNSQEKHTGGYKMDNVTFKLSDSQKECALWGLLNSSVDDEGNPVCQYVITEVYDSYAICYDFMNQKYVRAYYKKDDKCDSVEITSLEDCFIVDVNTAEKAALDAIQAYNGGNFEKIDEKVNDIESKNTEFSTKIEELNNSLATLSVEKEKVDNDLVSANENFNALTAEHAELKDSFTSLSDELATVKASNEELTAFKKQIVDDEKRTVIESYVNKLPDSVIAEYTTNMDNYSAEDLDMRLTYEIKKLTPDAFTSKVAPQIIPTDDNEDTGVIGILKKYKK